MDYRAGNYYEKGSNKVYTGKLRGFQKSLLNDLRSIESDKNVGDLVSNLVMSTRVFEFKKGGKEEDGGARFSSDSNGNFINYTPNMTTVLKGVGQNQRDLQVPSIVTLVHEMGHAEDLASNEGSNFTTWYISNIDNKPVSNSEKLAIHRENQYRASLNLPLREWYSTEYINNPSTTNGLYLTPGTRSSALGVTGSYINSGLSPNGNGYLPYTY